MLTDTKVDSETDELTNSDSSTEILSISDKLSEMLTESDCLLGSSVKGTVTVFEVLSLKITVTSPVDDIE